MPELSYQSGFGNEFATEAHAGALADRTELATEASSRLIHGAGERVGVYCPS